MFKSETLVLVFAAFVLLAPHTVAAADKPKVALQGVNLAGAEFGGHPGKHAKTYIWPSAKDVNMYADIGMNVVRVPFSWARMQPDLYKDFDRAEIGRLDAVVKAASARKVTVLIDPHNYGGYRGKMIGSEEVPSAAFADFWTRMAAHYIDQPYVAFGLMNEPNKHKAKEWAAIAKEAIDAIRKTGAKQTIMVPGTRWTGAHSWFSGGIEASNASALENIKDPANNFVFEVHQYFDGDSSGTKPTCANEDVGVKRLEKFTAWLKRTGHKGFLGEFGASKDPVCLKALEKTLKHMADNADVWHGWTYWAAAKWFGNYMFNIYPPDAEKFPQVGVLKAGMGSQ